MTDFRAEDWLTRPHGLAQRFREAREAAGMLAQDVGAALHWDPAKVSKTENGKRTPTAADIHAWAEVTGLDDSRRDEMLAMLETVRALRSSFKDRMRYGRTALQGEYDRLYRESSRFRIFQTIWIPGILQVPDYARAVFIDLDELRETPRDVEPAVQTRIGRQQHLNDLSKRFEIIVCEAALRTVLADPQVMRVQLDRLISVTMLPNVRFGIIPLLKRIHTAPQASFVLYDELAVTESFVGETRYFTEEAALLGRIMERLWNDAVEGAEARGLIRAIIEDLTA
ncbi:helix-turn-helix domain-containing protein [Actinoplanes sp. NPDC051513]|uniref:helix-turn-helix domain-containing protein n=1 Tax=Actinoplanes sp. NPDC051513 TaxID=3363908 RepID=UPI0037A9E698